jgi:hypothetical protein
MEIKQKKKMLLEVLLVIVFFVLVVFGIIYSINKIIESQPVQSSITFIYDEEALFKQNVEDAQSFIKSFIDNTEYNISDIAPWLNLKQRPLPVPEVAIENADAGASTLNEESVTSESLNPSINSKHEEVKPAKN